MNLKNEPAPASEQIDLFQVAMEPTNMQRTAESVNYVDERR